LLSGPFVSLSLSSLGCDTALALSSSFVSAGTSPEEVRSEREIVGATGSTRFSLLRYIGLQGSRTHGGRSVLVIKGGRG
jgi:hypothetical protein